jgi:hypothetical protein
MGSTTSHTGSTPYHRIANNSTQTNQIALLQQASGELWGAIPKNGGAFRTVQAYRGGLPTTDRGIEFVTPIPPTKGTGTPHEARWVFCEQGLLPHQCSPSIWVNAQGYAVLQIRVTKVVL